MWMGCKVFLKKGYSGEYGKHRFQISTESDRNPGFYARCSRDQLNTMFQCLPTNKCIILCSKLRKK